MMMICNKAGSLQACSLCPESKSHNPAPLLVPKNIIEQSLCMESGRAIEVNLIPAKESTMGTKEQTEQDQAAAPYEPPAIEMIPVTSSNIESVGHDGNETLRMKFKTGTAFYDYVGISEAAFLGLVNSDSVGKAYRGVVGTVKGIKFELPA